MGISEQFPTRDSNTPMRSAMEVSVWPTHCHWVAKAKTEKASREMGVVAIVSRISQEQPGIGRALI